MCVLNTEILKKFVNYWKNELINGPPSVVHLGLYCRSPWLCCVLRGVEYVSCRHGVVTRPATRPGQGIINRTPIYCINYFFNNLVSRIHFWRIVYNYYCTHICRDTNLDVLLPLIVITSVFLFIKTLLSAAPSVSSVSVQTKAIYSSRPGCLRMEDCMIKVYLGYRILMKY